MTDLVVTEEKIIERILTMELVRVTERHVQDLSGIAATSAQLLEMRGDWLAARLERT